MDDRTKAKFLKSYRILGHILEGQHAGMPGHVDRITQCMDGLHAAHALVREYLTKQTRSEVKRLENKGTWKNEPAVCEHCGKTFLKKQSYQRYCSQECGRNERRQRERERKGIVPQQPVKPVQPKPAPAYSGPTDTCPRLHVKAVMGKLPCGERPECFGGVQCEHVPAGAKRVTAAWTESFGLGRSLPVGDY
jgi:hypothetical protein